MNRLVEAVDTRPKVPPKLWRVTYACSNGHQFDQTHFVPLQELWPASTSCQLGTGEKAWAVRAEPVPAKFV